MRLLFTPSRNGKLRLMREYFASQPDPERGWALAALTGELVFDEAKPNQVRALAAARVDPELLEWSYDFVGDLAETVSLIWPAAAGGDGPCAEPWRDRRRAQTREPRRGRAPARTVARRARRDRALGAPQARHRQSADRRLGPPRQDRTRRVGQGRGRSHRRNLARARDRLTSRCSIGSKAASRRRRPAICRPSAR